MRLPPRRLGGGGQAARRPPARSPAPGGPFGRRLRDNSVTGVGRGGDLSEPRPGLEPGAGLPPERRVGPSGCARFERVVGRGQPAEAGTAVRSPCSSPPCSANKTNWKPFQNVFIVIRTLA